MRLETKISTSQKLKAINKNSLRFLKVCLKLLDVEISKLFSIHSKRSVNKWYFFVVNHEIVILKKIMLICSFLIDFNWINF